MKLTNLVAINADHDHVEALLGGEVPTDPAMRILAAWRAAVDADPLPPINLDDACAAVALGHLEQQLVGPSRRRRRAPLIAVAASALIAMAGLSGALDAAAPGDALWPAAQALHTERATSVAAAFSVANRIARAKAAIAAGRPGEAADELLAASAELPAILPEDAAAALGRVQAFLLAKTSEQRPGVPLDPGAPLRLRPDWPVPVGSQLGVGVPGVPLVPVVVAEPLPAAQPAPAPVLPAPAPIVAPPPPPIVVAPDAETPDSPSGGDWTVEPAAPAPPAPSPASTTAAGSPVVSSPGTEASSTTAQPAETTTVAASTEPTTDAPTTASETSTSTETPTPTTESAEPANDGGVLADAASAITDPVSEVAEQASEVATPDEPSETVDTSTSDKPADESEES